MNMHVQPDVSGAASPCLPALLDIDQLRHQAIELSEAFELIGTLVKTSKGEAGDANHDHEKFLGHIGLVASMASDMACDMLESLFAPPPEEQ